LNLILRKFKFNFSRESFIELIMGRLLGSKNKSKCYTTLSLCLTTQVEAQNEEHLERENHNVLAVINGKSAESD
jgi:hypothetical protein